MSQNTPQNNLLSQDLDRVRALLEAGFDPNAFAGGDAEDVRPLAILCFGNRLESVRLLLQYKADPNLGRESTAETPLHYCTAQADRAACIVALLAAGAEVNSRAGVGSVSTNFNGGWRVRGETPLHRAAAYGDDHVVRLLLEAGADKSIVDARGDRPYDWAVFTQRAGIMKLLR